MTELLRLLDALAQPLVDPSSRTYWPWLLIAAGVALVVARGSLSERLGLKLWLHPSSRADLWMLLARRLIALIGILPEATAAVAVGIATSRWLDRTFGIPELAAPPSWLLTVGYTLTLFVVWDASRYVIHRLMHAIPALWAFHQVHHSAEVLTPLSFHRIHPVESAIYTLRGIVVSGGLGALAFWLFRGAASPWTILGAHGLGMLLNAATGNLRHSHVWLTFGPVERYWISPAQHQLHHSPDGVRTNYGTWLAIWDRLGGTLQIATDPPDRLGLDEADRNHDPHDLLSMLVRPVLAGFRAIPRGMAWSLLLVAGSAWAQEDDDTQYEVIVEAPDGVPRMTGSAHRVDEEQLDRFEYETIDQVLNIVPGVYVRTEEGLGLRPNIGMRGGNADRSARIALMEDGVLFGPAPYAAPAAYYFPMVSRVTAVEVFKGPSAIRHGPQTIGGAINLVTRDVPRDGAHGAIDVAVGQRKTLSANGWVGQGTEDAGWLLDGAHLNTDGFKELDTGGPTAVNRQDLMFKGRLHDLELKLGYGHEDSHETYLGLTADDFAKDPYRRYAASDGDHMTWRRTQAELSFSKSVGHTSIRSVAYHHWLDRQWFKVNSLRDDDELSPTIELHDLLQKSAGDSVGTYQGILRGEVDTTEAQAVMKGTNDRTFHSFGWQTMVAVAIPGEAIDQELELGLRLHGDRVARLHTERPFDMIEGSLVEKGGRQTTLDIRTSADALAVYAHDELVYGRFELHPGVRTEVVRTAGDSAIETMTRSVVLPGIGALFTPIDRLDLFGGIHRGYSPVPPEGGRDAVPETALSYEAGIRGTPGETHLEAVAFFSDYANLTGQCSQSAGCAEDQLGQQFDGSAATIYGLEATGSQTVRLPGRIALTADGSYTLTQAWFRTAFTSSFPQFGQVQAGDFLPYVPMHQGAAQLAMTAPRVTAAFSASGRSELRDEAGQDEVPEELRIPGLVTLDASGSVLLGERTRVYATATNLLDTATITSWRPFGARPGPPRQILAGVKGNF